MDVLRLITIFESEVLEERICGERSGEESWGEEERRVREDRGLGFGEEEWFV